MLFSGSQFCNSADFDGTNDYMTRGGTLTGIADGKQGTISFWIRIDGGDGTSMRILATDTFRFAALRVAANNIRVFATNSADVTILLIDTTNTYTTSATWLHFLASWDLATVGARYIYVNNAADLTATTFTDDTIDYTAADWSVGAMPSGLNKLDGCLAELWFTTTFLDISSAANRAKFIAAGKPVFLGTDGSLPTGTAPLVYQRVASGAAVSSFATNLGTGGNFSITGTLTTGSTSPG